MPDKMSKEKIDLLRAYGAEVVVTPTDVAPSSPQSYYRVADRLTEEIPGGFQPNQYANPANPQTHYETTGPELWRQTRGRITHLVIGVGTGGTITGIARYVRERNPAVVVVGADPEGSIFSGDEVHPYLVEGVGEDFWPQTYDPSVVDRYVRVSDREAFLMTRRLAEREGMLVGGSGGLAVHAALCVAREVDDPGAMIAVVLPDGGRGYLSKIFNDAWMRQYGFLARGPDKTVGDVLRAKTAAGEIPPFVVVQLHERVRDAIALLHEHRVSQLPVTSAGDSHAVVGSVAERGLLRRAMETGAHGHRDRRRDGAAVPRGGHRGLGARGGRAAQRGPAGADGDRGRPRGGDRDPRRPPRGARHMTRFATRAVHAGLRPDPGYRGVVPAIHQAPPTSSGRPGTSSRTTTTRARRTRRGARSRTRSASSRAGWPARSPPGWPPSTRSSPPRPAPATTP